MYTKCGYEYQYTQHTEYTFFPWISWVDNWCKIDTSGGFVWCINIVWMSIPAEFPPHSSITCCQQTLGAKLAKRGLTNKQSSKTKRTNNKQTHSKAQQTYNYIAPLSPAANKH